MPTILLLAGNFFVLIICLMGAQSCYFKQKWKWFWLMIVCVLLSGSSVAIVIRQWLAPASDQNLPTIVIRDPTTPL